MTVESEVLVEIQRLRARMPAVSGVLVGTLDGLLIAHDTTDVPPEGIAALSAAAMGLGRRMAATVRHSDVQEVLIRGSYGYVAVYAAGPRVLLTVIATASVDETQLGLQARQAATRIAAIVDVLDVFDFADTNSSTLHEVPRELPRRRV